MKEFRKIKSLNFMYEIDQNGIVRNIKSKKILKFYINKDGYKKYTFNNKSFGTIRKCAHQLIMEVWGPEKPEWATCIDHIDRNKLNNNINNLRWADNKLNSKNRDQSYLSSKDRSQCKPPYGWNSKIIIMDNEKEFKNSYEAAKYLKEKENITSELITISNHIRQCANNKRKIAYKHTWEFK